VLVDELGRSQCIESSRFAFHDSEDIRFYSGHVEIHTSALGLDWTGPELTNLSRTQGFCVAFADNAAYAGY